MKKKIVCAVCGEIIEIETNEETTYCPKCSKLINVAQGEKYLSMLVVRYHNFGMHYLNITTEYEKAVESFKKVLEYDPNELESIHALAISLICSSTTRYSKLQNSLDVLKQYKDKINISNYNIESVMNFLKKVFSLLDQYKTTLENYLMNGGLFYEEKGKELYIKALNDILEYKLFLKDVYYAKRRYTSDSKISISSLNESIEIIKTQLASEYVVMGHPEKMLDSINEDTSIPERIFKNNFGLYKKRKTIISFEIISLLCLLVGIILIFALPKKLAIGIPVSGFFLLTSIILIIVNKSLKKKLLK